ncbi:MAG: type II secretion system protein E [Thermomicrobiales bacterium]|nr:type II secretion system protein E [Thermomicrobiales bacterium]
MTQPHGSTGTASAASPSPSDYGQPFGWWGSGWTPHNQRSLIWLIEREALDVVSSAFLTLAIEARASLMVIAEPHGAGKTTLLTALLDFLPNDIAPIFLRGWYERFEFLSATPASHAYLLCNEISAHLPIYLWGHGVRRVFDAVLDGYPLATTMHASSASDALAQLMSYPLEVPAEHLAHLDLVVNISVGYSGSRLLRRVSTIERIVPNDADAPRIVQIAYRQSLRGDLEFQIGRYIAVLAELGGWDDREASDRLARRTHQIRDWCARGLSTASTIRGYVIDARRTDELP